jgi:SAM-dependent methyltransferase
MSKLVKRPGVREGYDQWAATFDKTPNPLVSLDRRHTVRVLEPRPGEWILDAGCGTGAFLRILCSVRSRPIGLDISLGMLHVARRKVPEAGVVQADLNHAFPVQPGMFDALVLSLVSEHLADLQCFFTEAFAALRKGGRLVFSAFHPELARSGIEANFKRDGIEYRLGAEPYTVDDYLNHIAEVGFIGLKWEEYAADERVLEEVPWAAKYAGHPLLLLASAERPL